MKNLLSILIVLVFVAITFGSPSEFTKLVESYKTEKNFNGVVLVATVEKIDFISGVGLADRQLKTAIESNSKFKIASITKTFTAVLILKLYEQSKIDLNATIGRIQQKILFG